MNDVTYRQLEIRIMDKTVETMIKNLKDKTGRSLEDWKKHLSSKDFIKHGDYMSYLKGEMGISHGFANFITHKVRQSDASSNDGDSLISAQYKNKEHFLPIYEKIIKHVSGFGDNVEIAPKKAYVSLRAKKQFAMLKPATKTRFEIGLNLDKSYEASSLITINKAASMFSHQVNISSLDDLTDQVYAWLEMAYTRAS